MSAQDKLDRSAAKHGLGSDKRIRRIKKAKDFFSKPVPTYSKDELRKMGHPVEQNEGRFDITFPEPTAKNTARKNPAATARNKAKTAKYKDKIQKATAKDKARSASGSLTRTDDHRRKRYQTGKAGAYFSNYEAYRKPTQAEIDADKKKDGKGKDSSTRYRDMKKKVYGNAMGGLKDAAGQEFTAVPLDTTGEVSGGDRMSIAKLDAIMQKRTKDKRQKESVEMNEDTAIAHQTPYGTVTAYKRDTKGMRGKQDGFKLTLKTKSGKTVDLGSHPKPTKANVLSIVKNVMQKESVETNESSLPPHLQKIIGKDGQIDKKKVDQHVHGKKTKVTDVTPKGYGPKEEDVDEATMADRTVLRAVRVAKDMAGNHTGASKRIEKMKKGLSDHPKVKDALRLANESVSSADKKPQNFRDPVTGKLKVRMVPVDRDVVRGNDAAKSVARKKRFKHMRKEQMATGNSQVGKSGRDAFMNAFKDIQKTAAEIQKKKDADKK